MHGLLQWLIGKEFACNTGEAGDPDLIPGLGRSPGGGHGNPLQDSCLENPMGRAAWWATVHRVTESDTTERVCRSWWLYTNALMCSGQQNFLVLFTLPVASSADTDFLVASASSCHRCPLPLPQAQIKRIQVPRGTMNNPAESDISHSTFKSVHSTKHRGKSLWEPCYMFTSFLWGSQAASKGRCAHPESCEGWMDDDVFIHINLNNKTHLKGK